MSLIDDLWERLKKCRDDLEALQQLKQFIESNDSVGDNEEEADAVYAAVQRRIEVAASGTSLGDLDRPPYASTSLGCDAAYRSFEDIERVIQDVCRSLEHVFPGLPREGLCGMLVKTISNTKKMIIEIVIVGLAKSGKSSLLECLIGHPLSPTGSQFCTAVPVAFHHAADAATSRLPLAAVANVSQLLVESLSRVLGNPGAVAALASKVGLDEASTKDRLETLCTALQQKLGESSVGVDAALEGDAAIMDVLDTLNQATRMVLYSAHEECCTDAATRLLALLRDPTARIRVDVRFEALVQFPHLDGRLCVVDCPGPNEVGLMEELSGICAQHLRRATGALLVVNVSKAPDISKSPDFRCMIERFHEAKAYHTRTFVCMSFADLLADDAVGPVKAQVHAALEVLSFGADCTVCALSAARAIKSIAFYRNFGAEGSDVGISRDDWDTWCKFAQPLLHVRQAVEAGTPGDPEVYYLRRDQPLVIQKKMLETNLELFRRSFLPEFLHGVVPEVASKGALLCALAMEADALDRITFETKRSLAVFSLSVVPDAERRRAVDAARAAAPGICARALRIYNHNLAALGILRIGNQEGAAKYSLAALKRGAQSALGIELTPLDELFRAHTERQGTTVRDVLNVGSHFRSVRDHALIPLLPPATRERLGTILRLPMDSVVPPPALPATNLSVHAADFTLLAEKVAQLAVRYYTLPQIVEAYRVTFPSDTSARQFVRGVAEETKDLVFQSEIIPTGVALLLKHFYGGFHLDCVELQNLVDCTQRLGGVTMQIEVPTASGDGASLSFLEFRSKVSFALTSTRAVWFLKSPLQWLRGCFEVNADAFFGEVMSAVNEAVYSIATEIVGAKLIDLCSAAQQLTDEKGLREFFSTHIEPAVSTAEKLRRAERVYRALQCLAVIEPLSDVTGRFAAAAGSRPDSRLACAQWAAVVSVQARSECVPIAGAAVSANGTTFRIVCTLPSAPGLPTACASFAGQVLTRITSPMLEECSAVHSAGSGALLALCLQRCVCASDAAGYFHAAANSGLRGLNDALLHSAFADAPFVDHRCRPPVVVYVWGTSGVVALSTAGDDGGVAGLTVRDVVMISCDASAEGLCSGSPGPHQYRSAYWCFQTAASLSRYASLSAPQDLHLEVSGTRVGFASCCNAVVHTLQHYKLAEEIDLSRIADEFECLCAASSSRGNNDLESQLAQYQRAALRRLPFARCVFDARSRRSVEQAMGAAEAELHAMDVEADAKSQLMADFATCLRDATSRDIELFRAQCCVDAPTEPDPSDAESVCSYSSLFFYTQVPEILPYLLGDETAKAFMGSKRSWSRFQHCADGSTGGVEEGVVRAELAIFRRSHRGVWVWVFLDAPGRVKQPTTKELVLAMWRASLRVILHDDSLANPRHRLHWLFKLGDELKLPTNVWPSFSDRSTVRIVATTDTAKALCDAWAVRCAASENGASDADVHGMLLSATQLEEGTCLGAVVDAVAPAATWQSAAHTRLLACVDEAYALLPDDRWHPLEHQIMTFNEDLFETKLLFHLNSRIELGSVEVLWNPEDRAKLSAQRTVEELELCCRLLGQDAPRDFRDALLL